MVAGGACGWTKRWWLNFDIKRKCTKGRSWARWPRRKPYWCQCPSAIPGPWARGTKVLRKLDNVIERPLFERSRWSGEVPTAWKKAKSHSYLQQGQEGGSGKLESGQPHLNPWKGNGARNHGNHFHTGGDQMWSAWVYKGEIRPSQPDSLPQHNEQSWWMRGEQWCCLHRF